MDRKRNLSRLLLSLAIFAALGCFWWQRWNLYDKYRLRNYQPSQQIASLATDTSMNSYGRRLFYVYYPQLNNKQEFNHNCQGGERTIVLGCYVSGTGIYIYNVTEPRLEGVLQVTSAHEMLHAAYDRLGFKEKKRVTDMLEAAYGRMKDERIRSSIEDYRKNGADITNELHSILGTEARELPLELEDYYKKYFSNRSTIVAYSEKYEQAFQLRKRQVEEADKAIAALRNEIENAQADLEVLKQNLEQNRSRLDELVKQQRYEEYNAGVPSFNQTVSQYNTKARYIGALIDKHNNLVAERNAIVLEEKELIKAIDSRPDTLENR